MKEQFENSQSLETQSQSHSAYTSKILGGLAVAAAALAITPGKAESMPTRYIVPNIRVDYFLDFPGLYGNIIDQNTPYKSINNSLLIKNTGFTECSFNVRDDDGVIQNNTLTLQVDKAVDHKWVRDTRFKQKSAPVSVSEDGTTATGKVSAHYNPRALADQNKNLKIRLNCSSEYKSANNRINFYKKYLGAYARVTIGNSIK